MTDINKLVQAAPIVSAESIADQQYNQLPWLAKPNELTDPRDDAPEYPIDGLGPILGPVVKDVAHFYSLPVALAANCGLAAAAVATQGHADVLVDGRKCPPSLMLLTEVPSGGRKSTADKIFNAPIIEKERERLSTYLIEHKKYTQEVASWEKAQKSKDKKSNSDGATGDRPVAPIAPFLIFGDTTIEGLHKALERGQPSQGLLNVEAGSFLGGFAMNPEQKTRTGSCLSEAWDGSPISRQRASDGTSKMFGRRLSVHLGFQPDIEVGIFNDPVLRNQGLLSRCLISQPQIAFGERSYKTGDVTNEKSYQTYVIHMNLALNAELTIETGSGNTLSPRAIALDKKAKTAWIAYYNETEKRMSDDGDLAPIRGWASKAPENVLRLAGVTRLLYNPHASQIDQDDIERAILLIRFYEKEALRLIGVSATRAGEEAAKQLLAWIAKQGKKRILKAEIMQNGPRQFRKKEDLAAPLQKLLDCGWLLPCDAEKAHHSFWLHPTALRGAIN